MNIPEKRLKRDLLTVIEAILGTLIAIISDYIFKNDVIAVAIFSTGLFITISRHLIYVYINEELTDVKEFFNKELKDTKKFFEVPFELYKLKDSISSKQDKDFTEALNKTEAAFHRELEDLDKGIIEYETAKDYIDKAIEQIDNTSKITTVRATTIEGCREWLENGQLTKYLNKQIEAIRSGKIKKITRIFLLNDYQISRSPKLMSPLF